MPQSSPTGYTLKRSWAIIFTLLLGIAASVILLEAGLRLSGLVRKSMTLLHERRLLSLKTGKTIHVLCLGESTTSHQYPQMLEEELNKRSSDFTFKVFDGARPGINSDDIVLAAPKLITKTKPDIITVMMGCNDGEQILDYGDVRTEKEFRMMRRFRVFALFRMLLWNIKTLHTPNSSMSDSFIESDVSFRTYVSSLKDFDAMEAQDAVYLLAEEFLPADTPEQKKSKFEEAVIYLKTTPPPQYIQAQNTLAFLYYYNGQYKQALDLLDRIIKEQKELNCTNWLVRAACLRAQPNSKAIQQQAINIAIKVGPSTWWDYEELADALMIDGNYKKALEVLDSAIRKFPDKYFYHTQTATIHLLNGNYKAAAAQAAKAARKAPSGNRRVMKKLLLTSTLAAKTNKYKYIDTNDFPMQKTIDNYKRLIKLAKEKGIILMPVQYPMRSVLPLKSVLSKDYSNLVFVENRTKFRKECDQNGFSSLFIDAFGGDYGHCTERGNRIIAKNIAGKIIKHITFKQETDKQSDKI